MRGRHFGAITLCALFLVACASGPGQKTYVHPKARKTERQPVSQSPPAPAPKAPLTATTQGPLVIDKAIGTQEARLPCNRGGSPHCELRIYQVNVSSFVDGSPDHKALAGYGPGPHTGDLEGVIGALGHIKAMGFNAIWLTPIFDSKAGSPHIRPDGTTAINARLDGTGYFTRDYFAIDPQFGTLETAQRLVNEAHSLGIKVFFDGVFGHHKGNVTPAPSGALPVDALKPETYEGGFNRYPGRIVDYSDPRSTAFYKEVARHWIDTLGIDGWRLDQAYQVPSGPLREIQAEIKSASDRQLLSGYVVGEMWGSADQIRALLGPSDTPALMSAFDFPTRYALVQTLAGDENGSQDKPASTINEAWAMGAHQTYPDHAIMNLMLGNHDLVRFGDLIQRAGKGDPTTDSYWARHRQAFTFMAAWSGPITFYYGEEIGAEVGGFTTKVTSDCAATNQCDDHIGRNMVSIPGVNVRAGAVAAGAKDLKEYLTALMTLRAATPALSSGARTHIHSDKDLYLDLKTLGADNYVLVMNVATQARQVTLLPQALGVTSLTGSTLVAGEMGMTQTSTGLVLDIPALGAAIIRVAG
jgi:cyclomaltodextrinase / maltogenic alpha-amylase / neopullulanase